MMPSWTRQAGSRHTGTQIHDLIATWTQQDVETDKLFIDVARYNARVIGTAHVRNVATLACKASQPEMTNR